MICIVEAAKFLSPKKIYIKQTHFQVTTLLNQKLKILFYFWKINARQPSELSHSKEELLYRVMRNNNELTVRTKRSIRNNSQKCQQHKIASQNLDDSHIFSFPRGLQEKRRLIIKEIAVGNDYPSNVVCHTIERRNLSLRKNNISTFLNEINEMNFVSLG